MGSADIVPGVSGGTMALILGIYERLLNTIRSFDSNWLADVVKLRFREAVARNDLPFILPLFMGIFAALLFFTRVVPLPSLIISHPEEVYGLFFGLIVASIIILFKEVDRYGFREVGYTIAGTLLGLLIVNMVPVETPISAWFIFLCGFIAICAMLLPGISGSFILLILGKYAYIIAALGNFDFGVIAVFSAGALAGLMTFSRAIGWLLERYRQSTLLIIKGILIGSLWIIWPYQERSFLALDGKLKLVGSQPFWPGFDNASLLGSFLLMVMGFVLVLIIHHVSQRKAQS